MNPLVIILICLIVMYALAEILRQLSVPRVVSQITAGMILGLPLFRSLFSLTSIDLIHVLADMGVILLLFFVGLQIDVKSFEKNISGGIWVSLCNTSLPLLLGFLASRYVFGLASSVSILVGICMSVSASALALDLLEEYHKLRTRIATFIISASTIDDIVELVLITTVLAVIETTVRHSTLLQIAIGAVLFAVVVFVFRFYVIPLILHHIEGQPEHHQLFTGALIITLLMAVLADKLGMGAMIGALFSGLIMRQILFKEPGHKPWERIEIAHGIHTIAFGFLVPFFFFYIGFQTDVLAIWQNILFSVTITILAIIGTVVGSAFGYWITYRNWQEGWVVGWAMNAKGDTELVIAQLALTSGAITPHVFSALIFMAVTSTLVSPFILRPLLKRI